MSEEYSKICEESRWSANSKAHTLALLKNSLRGALQSPSFQLRHQFICIEMTYFHALWAALCARRRVQWSKIKGTQKQCGLKMEMHLAALMCAGHFRADCGELIYEAPFESHHCAGVHAEMANSPAWESLTSRVFRNAGLCRVCQMPNAKVRVFLCMCICDCMSQCSSAHPQEASGV